MPVADAEPGVMELLGRWDQLGIDPSTTAVVIDHFDELCSTGPRRRPSVFRSTLETLLADRADVEVLGRCRHRRRAGGDGQHPLS